MSAYTLGMDVSFYQESMDWARAFQHGIRFAFIKATERTSTIDRRFESNWSNAGKAGILKGAYHFYRSQYSARQQAAFFHQVVSRSGDLGDLPPVLDVEDPRAGPRDVKLCLDEIQRRFGRQPIIYTGISIWNDLGTTSWAPNYSLWIANYRTSLGNLGWRDNILEKVAQSGGPRLPRAFNEWTFWQFTQNAKGPDFGAESRGLDLNVFQGSEQALRSFAGLSSTPGEGQGDDWESIPLPSIPSMPRARVTATTLDIRDAPLVADNTTAVLPKGDIVKVIGVFRRSDFIWLEIGYRQWIVYKRRSDRAEFLEFIS